MSDVLLRLLLLSMQILSYFRNLKSFLRSPYVKHRLDKESAADFLRMASGNYVKLPSQSLKDSITFYAIGDAGAPTSELRETALAMNTWAVEHGPPDMILGLGDNFYKMGVTDVNDPQFKRCWSDVFLKYEHLRVPWRMILGNHDYMGSPQAQIDFTTSKRNPGGLWQLPNTCYSFAYDIHLGSGKQDETSTPTTPVTEPVRFQLSEEPVTVDTLPGHAHTASDISSDRSHESTPFSVEFFGLDTNGCQQHVARVFPTSPEALVHDIDHLKASLEESASHWKIVFGHHPCYSQGRAHGQTGQCLRQSNPDGAFREFSSSNIKMPLGFGLEEVLQGGVSAYFCAHEHVFQHHEALGVHHFMCGASGAELRRGTGLYDGPHTDMDLDWVGGGQEYGFVACTVTLHNMCVQFISAQGIVLKEVKIVK